MFPVFNIILAFFTNNMCFVCIFFILKVKKPFPYKLKAFKKRKFFRTFLSRDFGYKQSIIVKQHYYLAHTVAGGNGSLYRRLYIVQIRYRGAFPLWYKTAKSRLRANGDCS